MIHRFCKENLTRVLRRNNFISNSLKPLENVSKKYDDRSEEKRRSEWHSVITLTLLLFTNLHIVKHPHRFSLGSRTLRYSCQQRSPIPPASFLNEPYLRQTSFEYTRSVSIGITSAHAKSTSLYSSFIFFVLPHETRHKFLPLHFFSRNGHQCPIHQSRCKAPSSFDV